MTFVDVLNIIGYVLIAALILYCVYCLIWFMIPSYGAPKRVNKIDNILAANFFVDREGFWHSYSVWRPKDKPKCVVFFFHGMGVYAYRYNYILQQLCDDGCLVFGMDHRGHGSSDGVRCYVKDYHDFVNDQVEFINAMLARDECAGLPVFTMGHSLGGGLCILVSEAIKEKISGALILSPCVMLPPSERRMRPLAAALRHVFPRLPVTKLDVAGLSHNSANNETYGLDFLVYQGGVRVSTGYEIFRIGDYILGHLPSMTFPFLVAIGAEDPICDPEGVREFYEGSKSADKVLKLYDGMLHEIHMESIVDTLVADLKTFISKRL